jgi:hypothetical protein
MACSYRKAKSSLTPCLALTRLHVILLDVIEQQVLLQLIEKNLSSFINVILGDVVYDRYETARIKC